jgi:hypothetical protein
MFQFSNPYTGFLSYSEWAKRIKLWGKDYIYSDLLGYKLRRKIMDHMVKYGEDLRE